MAGRQNLSLLLPPWLLLSCCCFLFTVPSASKNVVSQLPGFHGPLPFSLETGYVEVDESHGVRLFYYFVESERAPESDPLLLWLTGGPGCSGLSGLVYEIGPFTFDYEGYRGGTPTSFYRSESWTKVSNVIFVDSPVGTGFSYAMTEEGFRSSDTKAPGQLLIFLRKWLDDHPQFLSNPLYIAGDSYSGMIIPVLTLEIARDIESGSKPLLNLKGYISGNPLTDKLLFDNNARVPYLHGVGLVSDELYELARKTCRGKYGNPPNAQCANAVQAILDCTKDVNDVHILEPRCDEIRSPNINKLMTTDRRKRLTESTICRNATYVLSAIWANDGAVRVSLGIHKETVPSWMRCYYEIKYTTYIEDIASTVDYHLGLSTRGYRALIYSGDHDSFVCRIGTEGWIRSLNFSIVDDWRPWYVLGQVAGFTRTYSNNLTFVTVKGAGHTAPEYKPKECLAMVQRWLSGDPL